MSNEREGRNEHEVPERWSARQKTEAVRRLLRGEDLGEVSRELQVEAHVLEEWRRVFLESFYGLKHWHTRDGIILGGKSKTCPLCAPNPYFVPPTA